MALFWFDRLAALCPNPLTGEDPVSVVAPDEADQVRGRSMLVKRLKPIPVEAVVRGYLAGSGWKEYQAGGTVCGVPLPPGLVQGSRLPQPIFTPATKAEAGEHDENIDYATTERLIGAELAAQVRDTALRLYSAAAEYALTRDIIIADTKFEFGLDADGRLTVMDEMLTPDSSRFWRAADHAAGRLQSGFDKQLLRDWLDAWQQDGQPWGRTPPAPTLSPEIIRTIQTSYGGAIERLL
jgi:phosphoribosylaminoimidazole-succinocarboxamide synthase